MRERHGEQGSPLCLRVGPQDGGRGNLAARDRRAGAQAAGEVVEGGGGCRHRNGAGHTRSGLVAYAIARTAGHIGSAFGHMFSNIFIDNRLW